MKPFKLLFPILICSCCVSMLAAQKTPPQILAQTEKAKVVREEGQDKLVLITGRKTIFDSKEGISKSADIELRLDVEVWNALLDLIDASWDTKPIQMKALDGSNVDVQKARINNDAGLIFTSGTAHVALADRDVKSLLNQSREDARKNNTQIEQ